MGSSLTFSRRMRERYHVVVAQPAPPRVGVFAAAAVTAARERQRDARAPSDDVHAVRCQSGRHRRRGDVQGFRFNSLGRGAVVVVVVVVVVVESAFVSIFLFFLSK